MDKDMRKEFRNDWQEEVIMRNIMVCGIKIECQKEPLILSMVISFMGSEGTENEEGMASTHGRMDCAVKAIG